MNFVLSVALGQLVFFAEFLEVSGLFERWVEGCPMNYSSPNAPEVTSMDRAAEAAVQEAKTLLVGAIREMTVEDAKGILTGGDDAATQYFRKSTEAALTGKFKPVINKSMQKAS